MAGILATRLSFIAPKREQNKGAQTNVILAPCFICILADLLLQREAERISPMNDMTVTGHPETTTGVLVNARRPVGDRCDVVLVGFPSGEKAGCCEKAGVEEELVKLRQKWPS